MSQNSPENDISLRSAFTGKVHDISITSYWVTREVGETPTPFNKLNQEVETRKLVFTEGNNDFVHNH